MAEGTPDKEGDIAHIKDGLKSTVRDTSSFPGTTVSYTFEYGIFRPSNSSEKISSLINPSNYLHRSRRGIEANTEDNEVIHSLLGSRSRFLLMSPFEVSAYQVPDEEIDTKTDSSFRLRLRTSIMNLDYHIKIFSSEGQLLQGGIHNFSHRLLNRIDEASQRDFNPASAVQGLAKAVEGAKLYPGTVVDHAFPHSIIVNKDIRKANIKMLLTSDVFYQLDTARQREME